MLRYILVLLLVSGSYRSFGNPINPNVSVSIVNSMTSLAAQCQNNFLKTQIKSKIINCTDLTSPHGEKQLHCLIFYDMSRQLCEAVATLKVQLPQEDYTNEINSEQDVITLCSTAKDWVFSNSTEFSHYKSTVEKVFKHAAACSRICSGDDLMSDEANFYCKYYKWGTNILKQVPATSTQQNAQQAPKTTNADKAASLPKLDLNDVQVKETSTAAKSNTPTSNNPLKVDEEAEPETIKPAQSPEAENVKSHSDDPALVSNVAAMPEINTNVDKNLDNAEDTGVAPDNNYADDLPSKSPEDLPVQTEDGAATSSKVDKEVNKPEQAQNTENKEGNQSNNNWEHKPVIESPKDKVPSDPEDYSDEGKEDLPDMEGGIEGDDQNIGEIAEESKPAKKAEAVGTSLDVEKESFYANPVQDAFPENDDHFFSFFLTAVVLVVLLYVLYHNKNKVSKVFFGLILEGRQAGRRRNSRGHAYRRLDTLEQAMSASSTAPPSKIIY